MCKTTPAPIKILDRVTRSAGALTLVTVSMSEDGRPAIGFPYAPSRGQGLTLEPAEARDLAEALLKMASISEDDGA